jgi:hypothetical protein
LIYIHTFRFYRNLHTFQLTVAQALGFQIFTSRILGTDLSQSHSNFKTPVKSTWHRLISFLLFLQLPIPRLDPTTLDYCCILRCTPPKVKVKVTLRLMVSQSVTIGVEPRNIYYSLTVTVLFLWAPLSDKRTGLSFVYEYAAGPRQRSLSQIRVSWDS